MTASHEATDKPRRRAWQAYAELTVGRPSLPALLLYELVTGCLAMWPGAAGILLRRVFYRMLLGSMGSRVSIGRNVVLRGAGRIHLGADVMIDDGCVLDARGPEGCVTLGDGVLLSRHTILRARNGVLEVGAGSDIGCFCLLGTDCRLVLGRDVLLGAYTYIVAGGRHRFDGVDGPVIQQGKEPGQGIEIGDGAWLGTRVTVLDGASVGPGAVIGAHALVTDDVPANHVAYGSPARARRERTAEE